MLNAVEITNLEKTYKRFHLDRISLDLPPGYILGLIGPNGAGKTTTLKIMMDMTRAEGGQVKIFGKDHLRHIKEIRNRVGYVGEDLHFYGDKSVDWIGRWIGGFYKHWDINRFQNLVTELGLSQTKKARDLSKGMKVKLALALALSHRPDLLILDEPTAGLDPLVRRQVLEMFRSLSKTDGKTVIISSHITDDITRIADWIVFLIEGRITLAEPKDDLLAKWKRIHYQEGTLDDRIAAALRCRRRQVFGNSGITDNYPALKEILADGMNRQTIKIENINLDDILIASLEGENPCGAF
jgi:ABC-2 type transport system ATP-binding protein